MEEAKTLFLTPERIVKTFNLEKGDHAADFGAGHGFFAIPMAKIVGGNGKVYAFDVQKSALDILRAKAKLDHLLNIEPVWADLEQPRGSKLKDAYLDFVLIANILFQTENKQNLFEEAFRLLRPKGRLAIIEWDDTPSPLGPAARVKKDSIKNLSIEAGFTLDREFDAGSHHYGILFKKP